MTVGAPWAVDALPAPTFLHRLEIRSVFLASAVLVAVLVLAYLTNPGESSFRAYLTEQSFRQHLSRLDEADSEAELNRFDALDAALRRDVLRARARPPVHFASRAAVSLRTPRHVLHSCGVLTLGAVLPDDDTRRTPDPTPPDLLLDGPPAVGDAWYVGAFGRWWRGGLLDAWWLDAIATTPSSKPDETAGILRMSTLDNREGLPFSVSSFASSLRGRDRSHQNPSHTVNATQPHATKTRDSTPPPLPESASLPLHTKPEQRTPHKHSAPTISSASSKGKAQSTLQVPKPPPSRSPSSGTLSTPSSNSDTSPAIAELLRQLAVSESSALDLRTQVADADAGALEARTALETELTEHRGQKRAEDAARTEMRTKTKALDDQKRVAEAGKREAERKLKNATTQREHARERMAKLRREIDAFDRRGAADRQAAKQVERDADQQERESEEEAERKRKEVKVAEDVVAALNIRAKDLEEMLEKERMRLVEAREQAEIRRQDAVFSSNHAFIDDLSGDLSIHHGDDELWAETDPFSPEPPPHAQSHLHSVHRRGSTDPQTPPRVKPRRLSLTGISNFDPSVTSSGSLPININASSLGPIPGSTIHARFSPFSMEDDDSFLGVPALDGNMELTISPGGAQNLLSTSLVRSLALDTPSTASTGSALGTGSGSVSTQSTSAGTDNVLFARSDNDPILPKPKRSSLGSSRPVPVPDWTVSFQQPPSEEDVFRVRAPPEALRPGPDRMDSQRAVLSRTRSDPLKALAALGLAPSETSERASGPRRWFSVSTRGDKDKDSSKGKDKKDSEDKPAQKRGLNPDAKAFTLPSASGSKLSLSASASLSRATGAEHMDLNSFISVPHLAGGFSFGSKQDPFAALSGAPLHRPTYDMLNPSATSLDGTTLNSVSSTSAAPSGWSGWGGLLTPSFSMRAFAPSKAERAVLGRGIGSSHSGSLEGLPSLSEVSLPGSPERAEVASAEQGPPAGKKWFQSLPKLSMNRGRKPKFSPFDDDSEVEEKA